MAIQPATPFLLRTQINKDTTKGSVVKYIHALKLTSWHRPWQIVNSKN